MNPRLAIRCPEMRRILARARLRQQFGHHATQAALLVFSAAAIFLVALADGHPARRWGYVVGLISQPLWIWSCHRSRQWGMLVLSFFYLSIWIAGVKEHFL